MSDSLTIDGIGPMPVERPQSVAELCAIVRNCADLKTAIYPVGGGTMLDYGMPPAQPGIALSTGALNQVIDYPARDLTITVQAGVTIQKLQETLAAENQWLPIDVPLPETATIGGAIACDVSGPRRYGYGTLRDYVIGITVVNDRGEETHAGGRVVKNVAGYDMMKLHTGALGTLGVITQVTLKVKPRPEDRASLSYCIFGDEQVRGFLDAVPQSKTQPYEVILVLQCTMSNTEQNRRYALVRFAGSPTAVDWQTVTFEAELARRFGRAEISRSEAAISFLESPRGRSTADPFPVAIRVRLRSIGTQELWQSIASFNPKIAIYGDGSDVHCWFCAQQEKPMIAASISQSDVAIVHDRLLEIASRYDGNAVLMRCPSHWKKSLPIWGHPPADLALQKAIKRALDPRNIFNPGRFVTDAFV
jgi:glycolate oxidase FAD binding subunit